MLGLRTSDGVNLSRLRAEFGPSAVTELWDALSPHAPDLVHRGPVTESNTTPTTAVEDNGERIRFTDPEGFLLSTELLSTMAARMPSLRDA